ncbi:MAG: hypothetical protein RQ714_06280 [Nitrosomonas sp.]|nr:hypothetical protein [Nitrosomonas sp.]
MTKRDLWGEDKSLVSQSSPLRQNTFCASPNLTSRNQKILHPRNTVYPPDIT